MYNNKKVLLIGGGGTLGTYIAKELLELGCYVDIICPEDKVSDNEKLKFFKEYATFEFLSELLSKERYDGIVNLILYRTLEEYKPIHKLLSENTQHLIFTSSYRVYADLQHPVTEEAPHLLDVIKDGEFLRTEDYALPKSKCEKFLREESEKEITGQLFVLLFPFPINVSTWLQFRDMRWWTPQERAKRCYCPQPQKISPQVLTGQAIREN